jgi:hypothetical protein
MSDSIRVLADQGPVDGQWDAEALQFGGNMFHSRAWGEACGALDGEVLYLRLVRGNRPVGVAVASTQRTRWRPLRRWRDVLTLNSPPALAPDVPRQDALSAIEGFAHRQGFGVLRVNSYADQRPSDDAVPDPARVRIQPRLEFRVALGPDLAATLARMGAGHRRNIRKAGEQDFDFSENTSLEGALALHALQEQTFHRRRDLGNENAAAWPVESYRRTMAAYLEARAIRFFFASRRGVPLSGIGTLEFGGSAYYLVGGTSAEGYTCKAVFALFAHTIERLIGQGCSELNLGGVGVDVQDEQHVDHGLYRFKAGFGSTVLTLRDVEIRLMRWAVPGLVAATPR